MLLQYIINTQGKLIKKTTGDTTISPVLPGVTGPSFTLTSVSRTSAGVYQTDGTLVRTLWSGETLDPGIYALKWDGTDDRFGNLPAGNYQVKVLSNNVQYTWEGVIGSTSTGQLQQEIHTSFEPMNKIVLADGKAFYCVGYNESNAGVAAFALNNIQVRLDPFKGFGGWVMSNEITTDGIYIYIGAYNNYHPQDSFVYAMKISDGSIKTFSAGTSYQGTNVFFNSVANLRTTGYVPTGIAVSDSFIFVSYKAGNIVSVLDKNTGSLVRDILFQAPTSLALDGTNLWVTSESTTVTKFPVNSDGNLGPATTILEGFSEVVDIRSGGAILGVVDGGDSQQVKAYNTSTGAVLWTLGKAGGIKASPLVSDDTFGFWNIHGDGIKYSRGGICFAPDGSFWIVDPSNNRMQHYDASRNLIERVMYMQHSRTCNIVGNNNTRLVANGAEFEIDYTKPLSTSWKLKYNWEGKLANFVTENWITGVNTLSNGRTYGLVYKNTAEGVQIVELDPVTGVRYTKVYVNEIGGAPKMYADGTIYGVKYDTNPDKMIQFWGKMVLVTFDIDNDPVYTTTSALPVTVPLVDGEPFLGGPHPAAYELTSSNLLVLFNGAHNDKVDLTYHLGAINPATGKMMFRTSVGTYPDYSGDFPADGAFDLGNGVGNAGNAALALERSILWGYNGEFWKHGQTNMYNHYYDNGLFIGQFGVPGNQIPGMAGNAYMPQFIKAASYYYLYHNDESVHGGPHRWKISGLETIQEQVINIDSSFLRKSEKPVQPAGTIDLMEFLPFKADLLVTPAGWSVAPAGDMIGWSATPAGNEEFSAKTSVVRYNKRKTPDVTIVYGGPSPKSVGVTLGSNNNLSNWKLSGLINYHATNPNYWDYNGRSAFLEVLDHAGKIIARIQQISDTNHLNTYYQINSAILFSDTTYNMQVPITGVFRKLDITKTGNSITASYYGYSATVTTPFETGADISSPATMRMYFISGIGGDAKQISLDAWKFSK